MLSKEKVQSIVAEVAKVFPTYNEVRTAEDIKDATKLKTKVVGESMVIMGELVAKLVLAELWNTTEIKMPIKSQLVTLHRNNDDLLEPMDIFEADFEFVQVNPYIGVTSKRTAETYKDIPGVFQISALEKDLIINLVLKNEETGVDHCIIDDRPSAELMVIASLNCLQVGIDLDKQEVVYTPEFEEFVNSKQLKVTNLINPNSTVLDLVIMQNDLPCYCKLETELHMLAQANYYHKRTPVEIDAVSTDHYGRAVNTFPNLFKYFKLDKENSPENKEISILTPTNNLPVIDRLMTIASDNYTFIVNYWNLYMRDVPKAQQEKFDRIFENDILAYYLLTNENYYDFKSEQPIVMSMRRFNKMLEKHPLLNDIINESDVNSQLVFSETIYDHIREHGEWVVGVLETNKKDIMSDENKVIDYEKLKSIIDGEVKRLNVKLIQTLDLTKFKFNSYIEELSTPLQLQVEGKKMHHCVGGYSNHIERGQSRIFHIETERGTKSTLEVSVSENSKKYNFGINQHKNVSNAAPDKENDQIAKDLVEFLNKEYSNPVKAEAEAEMAI